MSDLEHVLANMNLIIKITDQLTSMGEILKQLIDKVDKIEKDIKDERTN